MVVYLAGKPEDHDRFTKYAKDLVETASKRGRTVSIVSKWHSNSNLAEDLTTTRRVRESLEISTEGLMRDPGRAIIKSVRLSDSDVKATTRLDDTTDECLHRLEQADVIIADMDGGAVEAGYAIAKGKRVLTLGEINSPLANGIESRVKSFETWIQLMAHLLSPVNRFIYE